MTIPRTIVTAATMVAFSAMSLAAAEITQESKTANSSTVKVETVNPYSHVALIPQGSDLSSIKFQGVRRVEVVTRRKSTTDLRYCRAEAFGDPGGSMYCPYTQTASKSTAWRVTYSYRGQPMTSDEFGNANYTFSVYFRPEELSPAVQVTLAQRRITRADAAGFFDLTTNNAPLRQIVVDEAASTSCGGNYVDGNWVQTDSNCRDDVHYRTIAAPPVNITVRVDPALSAW